jgi:hypothetical protein
MATKGSTLILALCLIGLAAVSLAYAQGGFDLSCWTVDAGGGTSSGGEYALRGTTGQADAGALMRGGTYQLSGGFSGVRAAPGYEVHLPLVLRSWP